MASTKKQLEEFCTKYLMRYHSFILCKYEYRAVKLKVVIQRHRMVLLAIPYGIRQEAHQKGFTRPTEMAIAIIIALIDLIHEIHLSGLSLGGNLSIENLYWLPKKKLKLYGLKKSDFVHKTDTGVRKDFSSACTLIRDVLFEGFQVPSELHMLMRLMKKDPITYEDLILNNIILLDDVKKIGEYRSCYQTLQQLKHYNEMIYRIALSYISDKSAWMQDILDNVALRSVFTHNHGSAYSSTTLEESSSIFGRHCCMHILDYSVDAVNKVILFTLVDVFAMIECFVPGLFAEVQRAVFEVTRILFPGELAIMIRTSRHGEKLPKDEKLQSGEKLPKDETLLSGEKLPKDEKLENGGKLPKHKKVQKHRKPKEQKHRKPKEQKHRKPKAGPKDKQDK